MILQTMIAIGVKMKQKLKQQRPCYLKMIKH